MHRGVQNNGEDLRNDRTRARLPQSGPESPAARAPRVRKLSLIRCCGLPIRQATFQRGQAAKHRSHSSFGRGQSRFGRSRLFSSSRRVMVAARIARHKGPSLSRCPALDPSRLSASRRGQPGRGEGACSSMPRPDSLDGSGFAARCEDDRHHFPLHHLARGCRRVGRPARVHPRSCAPDGGRSRHAASTGSPWITGTRTTRMCIFIVRGVG